MINSLMNQVGSVWVPEAWVDQRVLRRQGSHKGTQDTKKELFCRIKMKEITCAYSSLSCIIEGQSSNLVINLGMPEDQSRGEIDYWPSHPEQMGLGKWILFIFIINNSSSKYFKMETQTTWCIVNSSGRQRHGYSGMSLSCKCHSKGRLSKSVKDDNFRIFGRWQQISRIVK